MYVAMSFIDVFRFGDANIRFIRKTKKLSDKKTGKTFLLSLTWPVTSHHSSWLVLTSRAL